jgi:hypothetical protein
MITIVRPEKLGGPERGRSLVDKTDGVADRGSDQRPDDAPVTVKICAPIKPRRHQLRRPTCGQDRPGVVREIVADENPSLLVVSTTFTLVFFTNALSPMLPEA